MGASSSEFSTFTTTKWNLVIWFQRFSSLLSIAGSSLILLMLLFQRGRARLAHMQNRLILGMTVMDIFNSIALAIGTAASPRELSEYIHGAIGNQVTCSIQSCFLCMGFSVPCYNACLSLYYMGVIKYNMSDDVLEKYECYAHFISIFIPLALCIFALSFDLFQPRINSTCWYIGDKCALDSLVNSNEDYECEEEKTHPRTMLKILFLVITGVILVVIVFSMVSIYLFVREQALAMAKYQSFRNENSLTGNAQKRGVKEETYIQSVLYIAAFFITFITPAINVSWVGKYFCAILFRSLLYPLQGLWNFITFIRPRFVVVREKHRYEPFLWVFKVTVFGMSDEDEKRSKDMTKVDKTDANVQRKKQEDRLAMLAKTRPQASASPPMYGRLTTQEENPDTPSSLEILKSPQDDDAIDNEKTENSGDEGNQPLSLVWEEETEAIQPSPSAPCTKPPPSLESANLCATNLEYFRHSHDNLQLEIEKPSQLQSFTTFTSLVAQDFLHNNTKISKAKTARRQSLLSRLETTISPSSRRPSLPSSIHLASPSSIHQSNISPHSASETNGFCDERVTHGQQNHTQNDFKSTHPIESLREEDEEVII